MKNFLNLLLFGFLGGVIGAFGFIYFSGRYSANISEAALPTPVISATPSLGFWERIISDASLASVGIQVFQANQLAKQGSGIIVSSDGLIATVADLVVPGAVYQIFYEDRIIKGTVVSRNYNLNLLIIKTDNAYSNIATLGANSYNNGQEVVLVGKLMALSSPAIFSQKGTISYITEKNVILDTVADKSLYGAGVVNSDGDFIGLSYLRTGKVNLIRAGSIQNFIQEYLDKKTK